MRFAVVGHAEWADFLVVAAVPRPGEIVEATGHWTEAAGGGAVAAVQLRKLAGGAAFFTALGDDEPGRMTEVQLAERGVEVHAAQRRSPQRRATVFLDTRAERTITTFGERLAPAGADDLPWELLAEADGVYFTGGDVGALRAARQARVLVATPRAREVLHKSDLEVDVLVRSDRDQTERAASAGWAARVVVSTAGAAGGTWRAHDGSTGAFAPAPLPGPLVDAYGAGDSFAAGLTFGLGAGMPLEEALALASRCGAGNLTGRGAYAGQPTAAELEVT